MNSKQTAIRVLGQRSITSSFLSRPSNPFEKTKEDVDNKLARKKDSSISLSDFLEQKLYKSSPLPKSVQGKTCPFSSLVGSRNSGGSIDEQIGVKEEGKEERNNILNKLVFEQFKHTSNEKGDDMRPRGTGQGEITKKENEKESRKRKDPFEGAVDEKHTTPKPFVVLGDNSKLKQKGRGEGAISMRSKKPRPSYNHYANGYGWWDSGMEGVDNEEVGYGEGWEGVGSTTFGRNRMALTLFMVMQVYSCIVI